MQLQSNMSVCILFSVTDRIEVTINHVCHSSPLMTFNLPTNFIGLLTVVFIKYFFDMSPLLN